MTVSAARRTNITTHFLREPRGLELVRDVAGVVAARGGRASVWCVGCATGDEAYGLALLCRDAAIPVDILASDINPDALAVARRGEYGSRNLRHVPPNDRRRWFREMPVGYAVIGDVARSVRFVEHDVRSEGALGHNFDVVLCRNVMVYFDAAETHCALANMLRALLPGGLLVLAASEWLPPDLRTARSGVPSLAPEDLGGVIAYRKLLDGPLPISAPMLPQATSPAPKPRVDPRRTRTLATGGAPPPPPIPVELHHPRVAELRRDGDRHLDAGHAAHAVTAYAEALSIAPLVVDLHLRMAVAQLVTRDHTAAEKALRQCVFIAPSLWPAWLLLAELTVREAPGQASRYLHRTLELLEHPDTQCFHSDTLLAPFITSATTARSAAQHLLTSLGYGH